MKNLIQLFTVIGSLLLLSAMITFSPTHQAEALAKWPNPYWQMLGKHQEDSD